MRLENGKYYIGRTSSIESRIKAHFESKGCVWTSLHKPMDVIDTYQDCSPFDEDKYTLIYMEKYGILNVRGGSYSQPNLPQEKVIQAQQAIFNAKNLCLACGSNKHFITKCRVNICFKCGRSGHLVENCRCTDHILGFPMNCCYRCGRADHWKWRCNRTRDIYGRILPKSWISAVFGSNYIS